MARKTTEELAADVAKAQAKLRTAKIKANPIASELRRARDIVADCAVLMPEELRGELPDIADELDNMIDAVIGEDGVAS